VCVPPNPSDPTLRALRPTSILLSPFLLPAVVLRSGLSPPIRVRTRGGRPLMSPGGRFLHLPSLSTAPWPAYTRSRLERRGWVFRLRRPVERRCRDVAGRWSTPNTRWVGKGHLPCLSSGLLCAFRMPLPVEPGCLASASSRRAGVPSAYSRRAGVPQVSA